MIAEEEAQLNRWRAQIEKYERKDLREEADNLRRECFALEQRRIRPLRLIADDTTPEALTSLMADNKGIITVISTEGGLFDIFNGKYSSNVVSIDPVLKAYTGDPIRVDRKGREAESIDNPALTMLLSAQESVLEGLLSNEAFRSRGLTGRILYSKPKSMMGYRSFDTPAIPETLSENYNQILLNLFALPYPDNGMPLIKLGDDALEFYREFSKEIEGRLLTDLEDMSDWGGKCAGAALRIAGLLHCVEYCAAPDKTLVSGRTMKRATKITRYFLKHAQYAYMLASVIPPSILMIVAASTAGISIGQTLMAGMVPGIFIGVAFMIYNYIHCKVTGVGEKSTFSAKRLVKAFISAVPALMVPVILLTGMYSGIYTPTEGAGIAVAYAVLVSIYVYKRLKWSDIPRIIAKNARQTGTILFIAITAKPAGQIFELDGLPTKLANFILGISDNQLVIMFALFAFLIVVGMFMDATAAIYILVPILLPVVKQLGVQPLFFVVFLVIALSFGLITPPVGVCLYAAENVTGIPFETVVKSVIPWLFLTVGILSVLIIFPQIITGPIALMFPNG